MPRSRYDRECLSCGCPVGTAPVEVVPVKGGDQRRYRHTSADDCSRALRYTDTHSDIMSGIRFGIERRELAVADG